VEPLRIEGAWVYTPEVFTDVRGSVYEWFNDGEIVAATGRRFSVAQANCPVTRRGRIRGIHYADVPPGQEKYITCVAGTILDVVVDLRIGSPTFGEWESVLLDGANRRAVYLSAGLGHAFMALSDAASAVYLLSTPYSPSREHSVHPLDPQIGIAWDPDIGPILSDRDAGAPLLAEAQEAGFLPRYEACQEIRA
jgi:dTDP-4-dehydrorhamnose 3,5-epimerase